MSTVTVRKTLMDEVKRLKDMNYENRQQLAMAKQRVQHWEEIISRIDGEIMDLETHLHEITVMRG